MHVAYVYYNINLLIYFDFRAGRSHGTLLYIGYYMVDVIRVWYAAKKRSRQAPLAPTDNVDLYKGIHTHCATGKLVPALSSDN